MEDVQTSNIFVTSTDGLENFGATVTAGEHLHMGDDSFPDEATIAAVIDFDLMIEPDP